MPQHLSPVWLTLTNVWLHVMHFYSILAALAAAHGLRALARCRPLYWGLIRQHSLLHTGLVKLKAPWVSYLIHSGPDHTSTASRPLQQPENGEILLWARCDLEGVGCRRGAKGLPLFLLVTCCSVSPGAGEESLDSCSFKHLQQLLQQSKHTHLPQIHDANIKRNTACIADN